MSLGEDIREVYEELGVEVSVIRDTGTTSGEWLLSDVNTQATKPERIEYLLKGFFPDNTGVIPGDIIELLDVSIKYVVMNRNAEHFQNGVVENYVAMSKVNVTGELQRSSGETRILQTMQKTTNWKTMRTNCYGSLVLNPLEGGIDIEDGIGQIDTNALKFIVPHKYDVRPLDRIYTGGNDFQDRPMYYKIEEVSPFFYNDVDLCKVVEDTRA